jgi:hypothetical protein
MKNIPTVCFILFLSTLNILGQTSTPIPLSTGGADENHSVSPSASPSAEVQAPPVKSKSEPPGSLYVRAAPRFSAISCKSVRAIM